MLMLHLILMLLFKLFLMLLYGILLLLFLLLKFSVLRTLLLVIKHQVILDLVKMDGIHLVSTILQKNTVKNKYKKSNMVVLLCLVPLVAFFKTQFLVKVQLNNYRKHSIDQNIHKIFSVQVPLTISSLQEFK